MRCMTAFLLTGIFFFKATVRHETDFPLATPYGMQDKPSGFRLATNKAWTGEADTKAEFSLALF